MIDLVVYPKSSNLKLINGSPFCAKVEIFLRLNKIDYKLTEFTGNPGKFQNGKLPVIITNQETVADSNNILEYLNSFYNINMDSHLVNNEKAQGFAFSKMFEEYFYWSMLHERWFIDTNWIKLKKEYFSHIPSIVSGFVTSLIRKSTKKSALGHGMSRHSDDEVIKRGQECLLELSNFLDGKPFLLGEKISSYDVIIYSFISSVLHSDLGPKLQEETKLYKNLVDYDMRMYRLITT